MNVYELVFAIVLVITVGQIIRSRQGGSHSRRRRGGGASETQQGPSGSGTDTRIEALEERIAVLERIVTDQGYELRQKFRDLE
jgi:hypothetical protein